MRTSSPADTRTANGGRSHHQTLNRDFFVVISLLHLYLLSPFLRPGVLHRVPANSFFLVLSLITASVQICATAAPVAASTGSDPEAVLYLIGDAGLAESESPVIVQLRSDLRSIPKATPTAVAFLGDNIYPRGLRTEEPYYTRDRNHLDAQIEIVRGSSATGIFLPGNHDWDNSGEDGLARLAAQENYLATQANQGVATTMLKPQGGCPGPETMRLGDACLLVFLDTQWWLHRFHRGGETCASMTKEQVIDKLGAILRDAELPAIVLGHHPLQTRGPHRGSFWRHILHWFVPRNQDLPNPKYKEMRTALIELFQEFDDQPLLYAAGHDHSLQVFDGASYGVAGLVLVSGSGSKLSEVDEDPKLLFSAGRSQGEMGYMKLEFYADGTIYLKAFTAGIGEGGVPIRRMRYETSVQSR